MGSYQHLSLVERVKIKTFKHQNYTQREIGRALGRSHTSIGRELRRNNQGHPHMSGYVPELAERVAIERKSQASQRLRLKSEVIRLTVQKKLAIRWTPEQIAATIADEVPGAALSC